jgi:hypothetical protein
VIAFLLPFATQLVGPRFARLAAFLALIVGAMLAVLALWGAGKLIVHRHDTKVIAQHEVSIANEISAQTNRAADDANAIADIEAFKDNVVAAQMQEDIHNATVAHPKEAAGSAGPAAQSALNRLRNRSR